MICNKEKWKGSYRRNIPLKENGNESMVFDLILSNMAQFIFWKSTVPMQSLFWKEKISFHVLWACLPWVHMKEHNHTMCRVAC